MPELELHPEHAADPVKVQGPAQKLASARDHYADDAKDAMKDATAKEKETEIEEHRALYFDVGEGFLELGLVLCSLYFLARKAFFPVFGILASVAGTAMGLMGFLL